MEGDRQRLVGRCRGRPGDVPRCRVRGGRTAHRGEPLATHCRGVSRRRHQRLHLEDPRHREPDRVLLSELHEHPPCDGRPHRRAHRAHAERELPTSGARGSRPDCTDDRGARVPRPLALAVPRGGVCRGRARRGRLPSCRDRRRDRRIARRRVHDPGRSDRGLVHPRRPRSWLRRDRRPHRQPEPARQAAARHGGGRIPPARGRCVRRRTRQLLARPRPRPLGSRRARDPAKCVSSRSTVPCCGSPSSRSISTAT